MKPRRMKFNVAHKALLDGTKTVTRRTGWGDVVPGEIIEAIRETSKGVVVLGTIRIVSVRRERADQITPDECAREGYPRMKPAEFTALLCRICQCEPSRVINRIEFEFQNAVG